MATKRMMTKDLRGITTVIGGRKYPSTVAVKNHHGNFSSAAAATRVMQKNEQCVYDEERIRNVNIGGRKVAVDARQARIKSLAPSNPSTSEKQRRYMGAALGRMRAGKSRKGDPKMAEQKLREFAKAVKK